MKLYTLYVIAFALLCCQASQAQVVRTTNTQSNQAKSNGPSATKSQPQPAVTMSQATDSLKTAVNDFKKSMNSLFGGKKDTIQIFVSQVEYDDASLSLLKESLKKVHGGKLVNMEYKSSNAILEVSYKGSSSGLWDQLPPDSKKAFRILEATDNSMTLSLRK